MTQRSGRGLGRGGGLRGLGEGNAGGKQDGARAAVVAGGENPKF